MHTIPATIYVLGQCKFPKLLFDEVGRRLWHKLLCVLIRSFFRPNFLAVGVNTEIYSFLMPENTDQKNPEYEHFSCSENVIRTLYFFRIKRSIIDV